MITYVETATHCEWIQGDNGGHIKVVLMCYRRLDNPGTFIDAMSTTVRLPKNWEHYVIVTGKHR